MPPKFQFNNKFQHLLEWCQNIHTLFEQSGTIIHQGRNQLRVYTLENSIKINVKRYKVPHLLNRVIYTFFRTPKCVRAYNNALRLHTLNIPTPEAIAYKIETRHHLITSSYLITQHNANLNNFYDFGTLGCEGREHIVKDFARFVAHMHRKGVLHKDLSPGNILYYIDKNHSTQFTIVDINRMQFKKIDINSGCANFARLWGDTQFLNIIAQTYAEEMNLNPTECLNIITTHHQKFWRNRQHQQKGYGA